MSFRDVHIFKFTFAVAGTQSGRVSMVWLAKALCKFPQDETFADGCWSTKLRKLKHIWCIISILQSLHVCRGINSVI